MPVVLLDSQGHLGRLEALDCLDHKVQQAVLVCRELLGLRVSKGQLDLVVQLDQLVNRVLKDRQDNVEMQEQLELLALLGLLVLVVSKENSAQLDPLELLEPLD